MTATKTHSQLSTITIGAKSSDIRGIILFKRHIRIFEVFFILEFEILLKRFQGIILCFGQTIG